MHPLARRAGALALLVVPAMVISPSATAGAGGADCDSTKLAPSQERALVRMINRRRSRADRQPLRLRSALRSAARKHSREMAVTGVLSHEGFMYWAGGTAAAQNVAMSPGPREAFRGMMRSRPHRRNLMAPRYAKLGVGGARSCDGVTAFTVNLSG